MLLRKLPGVTGIGVAVLMICLLIRPGRMTAQEAGASPQPLTAVQRVHLQKEEFSSIGRVADLPAGVRQGLQELFGGSSLELAEPGAEFQATDLIVKRDLPGRRLILAGCSPDHCLVHYERGGVAHTYQVALFSLPKTRLDWGGQAPGAADTLGKLKAMILEGRVNEQSRYW